MTMLLLSEASRVLEHHAQSSQPWDRRTVPIERGFSEDWVVRAFGALICEEPGIRRANKIDSDGLISAIRPQFC